jgi:hypothetical protein
MYIIEIIAGVICAILFIIGFIYSMFRLKYEFIIIEKQLIKPRHKTLSRKDILKIIEETNDDNIKARLKLALKYRKYQNRFYLSTIILFILFSILNRYVSG